MKTLSYLLLFTLTVVLWGCPYKSDVGIDDDATIKIDKNLLGTWHKASYPADSTALTFSKLTLKKYSLTATTTDGEGSYETHHYTAWFSSIDKWKLITLYDTESKKYSFGEAQLYNKELNLKLLSEDITTQQFTTTAAMRNFITDIYAKNKVIYDTDVDLSELVKEN